MVVQIGYQHTPVYKDGAFSLRVPLVVAPRYHPIEAVRQVQIRAGAKGWGVADPIPDPVPDRDRISPPVLHPKAGETNPVTLSVRLDAGFPLGDVTSSHHGITVTERPNGAVTVALADGPVPATGTSSWSGVPPRAPRPTRPCSPK